MTGTQITAFDAKLAEMAAQQQALEKGSGRDFLSTRAGQLKYQDQELPGNQLACVVIDAVRVHEYYKGRFNEQEKAPPVCYGFGRGSDDEMYPHLESMSKAQDYFMPQHIVNGQIEGCKGCPKMEWGSADQGEGKACKNKYRLTLLPAGIYEPAGRDWQLSLFDDPKHYETATPAFLSVPVTSGKIWSDYSRMLRTKHGRPPLGVFTRIHLTPHTQHQFHVNFELIREVPNELLGALIERGEVEAAEPFQGYQAPSEEDRNGGGRRGFGRR